MALPFTDAFGAAAGVLANPPWTPSNLSATRLNYDGAGHGKGSAADASFDVMAYDNSNTYGSDQYAQLTIAGGLQSGVSYAIVLVRASGSGATFQGYEFITDGSNAGAGHTEIYRYTGGVGTVKANFATSFTTNDVMKITVVGALVTVYKNGASIGTFNDPSPLSGGAAGCGVFNTTNNALIDTFEGGNVGVTVPVGLGALALTGLAPTAPVSDNKLALPGLGSLALTGFVPTINSGVHYNDVILWASYPTVQDVVLGRYLVVTAATGGATPLPGTGALTIAGLAPAAVVNNIISADVGALTLTGFLPTVLLPQLVSPGLGALTISGLAPTVLLPKLVAADVGALTLTGLAPAVLLPVSVAAGLGALTLTGLAPLALTPVTVLPAVGVLSLTGLSPTVVVSVTVPVGLGALVVTGLAPAVSVSANQTVAADVGSLTLAGLAPTVLTPVVVPADVGTLTVTGLAPSATVSSSSVTVTSDVGSLIVEGFAPLVQGDPVDTAQLRYGWRPTKGKTWRRHIRAEYAPTVIATQTYRAQGQTVIVPLAGELEIVGYAPTILAPNDAIVFEPVVILEQSVGSSEGGAVGGAGAVPIPRQFESDLVERPDLPSDTPNTTAVEALTEALYQSPVGIKVKSEIVPPSPSYAVVVEALLAEVSLSGYSPQVNISDTPIEEVLGKSWSPEPDEDDDMALIALMWDMV